MATKTYNMGRVVGWSTYEEFLKENPNIDPSKITSQVYSTLVTYGVTRVVKIPATASGWMPVQGEDTIFYTATVEVPGATYGAVPIVGINYDYYVRNFFQDIKSYDNALEPAGTNKELLEKAFSCIFTCYVSNANGVRVENNAVTSGYLTFAAYPDIVNYLEAVSEIIAPEKDLRVIVRGLSLSGFTDADDTDLYFGPQGIVVGTGGGNTDPAKYCEQDTIDISALCLNASGYIWPSTGGNAPTSKKAPFISLTSQLRGEILISTFGYLNPQLMEGTGTFANLGTYAYTYQEYLDVKGTPGLHIITVQVDAIPEESRTDYLYLIDGHDASYEALPQAHNQLFAIPVRKSDYYVNIGTFDSFSTFDSLGRTVLNKRFDMTRTVNNDDRRVIVPANKITANYLGSWWDIKAPVPAECKLSYWGQNAFNSGYWISNDIRGYDDVFCQLSGRTTFFKIIEDGFPEKGGFVILFNQPEYAYNGLYQCVWDESEDHSGYRTFVRRGAYLPLTTPVWVENLREGECWQVDLSSVTTTITDGVLKINGSPIYPGELVVIGTAQVHHQFFVINTIDNNAPKLILTKESNIEFSIDITDPDVNIWGPSDEFTNYISIAESDFRAVITAMSVQVHTDGNLSTYELPLTNTEFTPGLLFNIKHPEATAYGFNKDYRYTFIENDHGVYKFASGEIWTANPDLASVAGHPGTYNSVFPLYGQTLPTPEGSWHYNAPAVLSHTPAKKMFDDFGLDITAYVHEDYQNLSLGKFLQECVLRKDLTTAATDSTLRNIGVESTFHLYSKEDLNYTSGSIPTPTAQSPISSSMTLHASTSAKSYFSTAYYTATLKNGTPININNPDYPIWASVSKSPEGTEITSVSVTDNSGSQLDFSGNSGTIDADTVTWLDLLVGLGSGKSVDVLKGARFGRDTNDCNYIQTADGTRLYISTTEPTGDIPEGSIGIGW